MKSTSERDKQIVKIVKMRGNREKMDRQSAKVTYFFFKTTRREGENMPEEKKNDWLAAIFSLDVMS